MLAHEADTTAEVGGAVRPGRTDGAEGTVRDPGDTSIGP
jgi:hypothetical protein